MCVCVCLVFYICMYMDMDLYMNWGSSVLKKIKFQAREGGGRGKWGNFKNGGEDERNLKRKEKKRKTSPTSCVYT